MEFMCIRTAGDLESLYYDFGSVMRHVIGSCKLLLAMVALNNGMRFHIHVLAICCLLHHIILVQDWFNQNEVGIRSHVHQSSVSDSDYGVQDTCSILLRPQRAQHCAHTPAECGVHRGKGRCQSRVAGLACCRR